MGKFLVNIISGSDSDWQEGKGVTDAVRRLHAEGAEFDEESGVKSAHRSPGLMIENARGLVQRGVQYCIAAAGGAAHLPGMTASETIRPVFGLPIITSTTGRTASHFSIAEMPPGIPVATVGAGRGDHAASFILQTEAALQVRPKHVSIITNDPTQHRIKITEDTLKRFDIPSQVFVTDAINQCTMDFWESLGAILITDHLDSENVQQLAAERPTIILPYATNVEEGLRVNETVMSLLDEAAVVSVGISGGKEPNSNAGLLAARILATVRSDIELKLQEFIDGLETGVVEKQHPNARRILQSITG